MAPASIRHIVIEILEGLRQSITAVIGWLFGFTLTRFIKRNPGLILVISRSGPAFIDNSKYFFVYASEYFKGDEKVYFITGDRSIQRQITVAGGLSVLHPSLSSIWLILRAEKIVTDWVLLSTKIWASGATIIQIWHGAPLKHIELDVYKKRLSGMPAWLRTILEVQKKVIQRYPLYDIVVATSAGFIAEAFQQCFNAKKFIASGYPRNDILFGVPEPGSLAHRLFMINVDKQAIDVVSEARDSGKNICLYVPTFRKDMASPFDHEIDLEKFSAFAQQHNLLIVLKLHPFMHGLYKISQFSSLIEYTPLGDVYPLMALTDILITDYSSIFFDFLLLDRPILFFAYDLDHYLNQDRDMYFDYDAMTPGAKCKNYDELELQLEAILKKGCTDGYAEMRMKVKSYAHDHADNRSSQRLICHYLKKMK